MKRKHHRVIESAKTQAAAMGGFYSQIPLPGTFTCSVCGEERHNVDQEDGICLRCRWTKRAKERRDDGRIA